MELQLRAYDLKLKYPFGISRERYDHQECLIVSLTQDGKTGYGEAAAKPYYGITIAAMKREIQAVCAEIGTYELQSPEAFYQWMDEQELSNFSKCALDQAAHDLYGKLMGKPLYEIWGTEPTNYPITNYTIGLDSIEKMRSKMLEKPWPVYKIKLGTTEDVSIIKELRNHTDAVFRVDANCAWTARETIENAIALKPLGVEFIEQPLAADNWQGMEQVIHQSVLPVIADESCIREEDVDKCALHFNGINIKLTKCGGLIPARRMIARARELGLKVMVGCMTESSVGISAIAQLLPELDYVDMDGAMLLREDIAQGVEIGQDGKVIFPGVGGSGVSLLL